MQEELLKAYIAMVYSYNHLLKDLYAQLEPHIRLKHIARDYIDFMPQEKTITQQIQRWPQDIPLFPPVAWVEPRKGSVTMNTQEWSYAFHGAGLSFFHNETRHDVSAEFSRIGQVAITQWTVWCYVSTNSTDLPFWARLELLNEIYFEEVVARGYITPVPPLYEDDDQTYVIGDLSDT